MSLLKIIILNNFLLKPMMMCNFHCDYLILRKKSFISKCNEFSNASFHLQSRIKHGYSKLGFSTFIFDEIRQNGLLSNVMSNNNVIFSSVRLKSNRKKNRASDDDESSSDEEDKSEIILESGKDFRDIKARVSSLRMDVILKAGLGISRSKVEMLFYGSKLRINKEKIKKKSVSLLEGDTVDVIKGSDNLADAFNVEISRVTLKKIISFNEDSGVVSIVLRKYPKLVLQSYNDDVIDE